jgi:hypothetical protein
LFFVSVASKELNILVSPVFATLTRRPISVADKRLREIRDPMHAPSAILQRYDTKGFKGWVAANDMIPWELGG